VESQNQGGDDCAFCGYYQILNTDALLLMKSTFHVEVIFGIGAILGLSVVIATFRQSFSQEDRWLWAVWVFVVAAGIANIRKSHFYGSRLHAAAAGISIALATMIVSPIPGMILLGFQKEGAIGIFQGLIFGMASGFWAVIIFGVIVIPLGAFLGLVSHFLASSRRAQ